MSLRHKRAVHAVAAADAPVAAAHFAERLRLQTDPADVHADLHHFGSDPGFLLIDTRSRAAFAAEHLPGAINLQVAEMTPGRVAALPDVLLVTYCWSASCNGSTKGAARLAELGRPVKEMIGGLAAWKAEGFATAVAADAVR